MDVMEGARSDEPNAAKTKGRKGKSQEAYDDFADLPLAKIASTIKKVEDQMYQHARNLEFEEAAMTRDQIQKLRAVELTKLS